LYTYPITVAGLKRDLPICRVTDDLYIAGFVIFGDVELTEATARELNARVPDYDLAITAEAKGIPLIHEMTRQSGRNKYIVARKAAKLYMNKVVELKVKSITTQAEQSLFLDEDDFKLMKGRRILVVDDVVSTGGSLRALEKLVNMAGGIVVGRATILAEGEAAKRDDLIYLEPLPVFNPDGTVKE
jgi:adenine phosphoribosyltransferase